MPGSSCPGRRSPAVRPELTLQWWGWRTGFEERYSYLPNDWGVVAVKSGAVHCQGIWHSIQHETAHQSFKQGTYRGWTQQAPQTNVVCHQGLATRLVRSPPVPAFPYGRGAILDAEAPGGEGVVVQQAVRDIIAPNPASCPNHRSTKLGAGATYSSSSTVYRELMGTASSQATHGQAWVQHAKQRKTASILLGGVRRQRARLSKVSMRRPVPTKPVERCQSRSSMHFTRRSPDLCRCEGKSSISKANART